MTPTRRALILGVGAATVFSPLPLLAAGGGSRTFTVYRDGAEMGSHRIDVRPGADGAAEVDIDIQLQVKILGITAYRYSMRNREVWKGGRLVSMDSETNDDGDADFSRVRQVGDELEIEGSMFSGRVPGDSVSTTYWSMDFLKRGIWINTQTGVPIEVTTASIGPGEITGPNGPVATERWTAKGEKLDVILHYAGGEWLSVEFEAGGEPAVYAPQSVAPAFAPVWTASL